MSTAKTSPPASGHVSSELATCLGVRRTMTLRRIMRQTGLPPEVLLDLAVGDARHRESETLAFANTTALSASALRGGGMSAPRNGARRSVGPPRHAGQSPDLTGTPTPREIQNRKPSLRPATLYAS